MARPKNSVPTYRLPKPSGTARCRVGGRWVTLGKYNTPESRAEYARILADLVPTSVVAPVTPDVIVNGLLLGFWRYAEAHYLRPDGTPTNELPQFRQTFRLVRDPAPGEASVAMRAGPHRVSRVGYLARLEQGGVPGRSR